MPVDPEPVPSVAVAGRYGQPASGAVEGSEQLRKGTMTKRWFSQAQIDDLHWPAHRRPIVERRSRARQALDENAEFAATGLRLAVRRPYSGLLVRICPVVLVCIGLPILAAAAKPGIAREFARERFAPVMVTRQLPPPLWEAVARFIGRKSLADAGVAPVGKIPEVDVRPVSVERTFVLAGLGSKLDFVVYRHSPAWGGIGDHDHLLIFRRLPGDNRSLAFSCVGTLPRKAAQVSAAVADGRCKQRTGSVETD